MASWPFPSSVLWKTTTQVFLEQKHEHEVLAVQIHLLCAMGMRVDLFEKRVEGKEWEKPESPLNHYQTYYY